MSSRDNTYTNKDNRTFYLSDLTKDDIKEIREKKKNFYIHSDKAVKYGIVDEVL